MFLLLFWDAAAVHTDVCENGFEITFQLLFNSSTSAVFYDRTPVAGENGQKPATATIYFKMVFLKESLLVALLLLIIHD